jgi:hypothetical protein
MVKAFMVNFPEKKTAYTFCGGYGNQISSSINTYPIPDNSNDSILVIANSIDEVAKKYPTAITIMDMVYAVKEVVILDKIICPVK